MSEETEPEMDKQLQTSILLGWISGAFPVTNWKTLQSSWRSWTVPFSILLTLFYTVIEVWSIWAQKSIIKSMQPSKLIVHYLITANSFITCVIMRLWSLWRSSRIAQLVKSFLEMQQNAIYPRGSYMLRYYVLGYVMLLIDLVPGLIALTGAFGDTSAVATSNIHAITGWKDIPFWQILLCDHVPTIIVFLTRYFGLTIVLWLGVNLLHIFECFCWDLQKLYCASAVDRVHIIDDQDTDEEEEEEDDPTNDFKKSQHLHAGIPETGIVEPSKKETFFNELFDKLPNVLGSYGEKRKMTDSVSEVKNLDVVFPPEKTIDIWATTAIATKGAAAPAEAPEMTVAELSNKFLKIQQAFDEFNKVAGPAFFVLICYGTISLIHKLYVVAATEFRGGQADVIKFVARSIIGFLLLTGLSHLGEIMTARIKKWKEQLKCVMLTELLCEKCHDSINTLTESIIKWDWQLSAMSLFNINHALLPGIAGTMVTYLIVIIQLKVSENPNGGNSTGEPSLLISDE